MTDVKNIPQELKETGLFCVWRYEEVKGRRTKVPYNPHTGGRAQSNNPDTFSTFEEAIAVQSSYDGVGAGIFNGVSAIDIDHCFINGELSDLASDVISLMDAYTEISPSGTGIRILFKTNGFDYDKSTYYINNQKKGLEVYISGATNKYVTITGNALHQGEYGDRTEALLTLIDKYMLKNRAVNAPGTSHSIIGSTDYLAVGLKKDPVLNAFWNGERTGASESESDLAFMNKLAFWCSRDVNLMIESFKSSPYASGKDSSHIKKWSGTITYWQRRKKLLRGAAVPQRIRILNTRIKQLPG